jgi:hypothetical protein
VKEMGCKELITALEAAKAVELTKKREFVTALWNTGIIARYGSSIRLPLEDGTQIGIDIQKCLLDLEDECDGYLTISTISKGEDGHLSYKACLEPRLVAEAIELELQRELRTSQEWSERVTEITRLLR